MSCRLPTGVLAAAFLASWTPASPARAATPPAPTWINYLGFDQSDVFGDILRDPTTGDVLITGTIPAMSVKVPMSIPRDGVLARGGSMILTARFSADGTWNQWRLLDGSGMDSSRVIATRDGKLFIAGQSNSSSFNNAVTGDLLINSGRVGLGQNGFLAQLDPKTLQTQWVYLLDINNRDETINDLVILKNGEVVVVGTTVASGSTDAPAEGADADAFVIQLKITTGTGGKTEIKETPLLVAPKATNADVASTIALDEDENIYVAGKTASESMFTRNASGLEHTGGQQYDAFLLKWSQSENNFVGRTYFGGLREDEVAGMVIRGNDVFLVGTSASTDLKKTPVSSGVVGTKKKAFVARFHRQSMENVSTVTLGTGTMDDDEGRTVTLVDKHVYVGGIARSQNFPGMKSSTALPVPKGFVAKVEFAESTGSESSVKASSVIGGNGADAVLSLLEAPPVQGKSLLYIGGTTTSNNLGPAGPTVPSNYSSRYAEQQDMFLGRLDVDALPAANGPEDGGGSTGGGSDGIPIPRSPLGFACGANASGGGPGVMALLSLLGLTAFTAARRRQAPRE